MNSFIQPRRMVFMPYRDYCQFCERPTGPVYISMLIPQLQYGFAHCTNCQQRCNRHVQIYRDNNILSPFENEPSKNVTVKRSNGDIETDWKVIYPFVYNDGVKSVVFVENGRVSKCVPIGEFMELNSHLL